MVAEGIKELKKELKVKAAELETLKGVNLELHAHCRELTSALFNEIPQERREKFFEKQESKVGGNVIPFVK